MSEEGVEKMKKEIFSQLKPLIDFIVEMDKNSKNFITFLWNFKILITKFVKASDFYLLVVQDLDIYRKEVTIKPSARHVLYLLFVYLGMVETFGNLFADFVVALLIANGYEFHLERTHKTPSIKHVDNLKELDEERVSLTTKLNFIEDCGITLFKSLIDVQLRNDIAHMNFEVKDDMVYIKGEKAPIKISKSLEQIKIAFEVFNDLMKRFCDKLEANLKHHELKF
jgi:hypothetical protein